MVTGTFSVITGTFLYVVGSRDGHSEPAKEMCVPVRPTPEADTLWSFA